MFMKYKSAALVIACLFITACHDKPAKVAFSQGDKDAEERAMEEKRAEEEILERRRTDQRAEERREDEKWDESHR